MRTLAVMNQKGGTGKTTTSVTLAALLASRDQRTLLVDLDPQGHAGLALALPEHRMERTVADMLSMSIPPTRAESDRAMWRVRPGLTVVASDAKLAGLEAGGGAMSSSAGRERRLSNWLATLRSEFDVCVVDCSPSIGLLTFNALVAASAVLIPIETAYFALRGAERQLAMIDAVRARTGRALESWVVPTMHTPGEVPSERILTVMQQRFRAGIAPVPIRRDAAVAEAATLGVPITEHQPESFAASDYQVLADWIQGRLPMLDEPSAHASVAGTDMYGGQAAPMSRAAELAERARAAAGDQLRTGTIDEVKHPSWAMPTHGVPDAGGVGVQRPGGTDGRP